MKPKQKSDVLKNAWALTGGVASGKTEVAKIFKSLGFATIDADEIARELRKPGGKAHQEILTAFGTTKPSALREIIFKDKTAKSKIESILHPLIFEETKRRILALPPGQKAVYEASLVIESGSYVHFQGVIVVTSPLEDRIKRLMARDRISRESAVSIIQNQMPENKRLSFADWVIENKSTPESLRLETEKIAKELK